MNAKKTTPDHSQPAEKRTGMIQSVAIAARFLNVLANAEEPLALGVIARRTDTGASSAHRYLQSLVKEQLAAQDPVSGLYDLGPAALNVGIAALRRIDPVEIAAAHMKSLTGNSAASGGVAIWTERGPTLVRWYRSAFFSVNSVALGDVLPLDNTACGLVFQAFLPAARVDAARQMQPEHFRGAPPHDDVLANIRATGHAEMSNHLLPHVTGQAVPVFDAQQEIACVMTTVANLGQNAGDQKALLQAALAVAQETGGTTPFQGFDAN
ncbi:IclR family transcriptional regulator [Actibacterium lipolyticum]|uniref:Glycerol operon regulatory protein n=1 Tax=Actibacterium lipolyticum TaxID=1524263 RepID=A0A238L9L9_9RHOB|nr:IclR family transcriptional regulator [Actibacterium lipolyticum]SMX51062.1 Glycerol operon regulatory protein [Actibacterium lipolyticum]